MVDDSGFRYPSWEEGTTRDTELAGIKRSKEGRAVANKVLREMGRDPPTSADVPSPRHEQWSQQQRGRALEQCHLLTRSNHEGWTDHTLRELTRDLPDSYPRATLEQLQGADKKILRRLAEETEGELALGAGGEPPLAPLCQAICHEPGVRAPLLPQPEGPRKRTRIQAVSRSCDGRRRRGGDAGRGGSKKQDGKECDGGKKCDAEKRKDEDKGLQRQGACREDGEPLCFGFNRETCSAVAAEQKCGKGWHTCCKPKCKRPHTFKK